jgi:NAD(P)-dependent dehydrogenase (short-subunit alcohol dehydrogenase family)
MVITGGGSGLGRALAVEYGALGWRVAVLDRNESGASETAALVDAEGGDGLPLACDVTDEPAVARAAESVQDAWGGLDLLVNNAGVAGSGTVADTKLEDWRWILEVNVFGLVSTTRAFLPPMLAQRSGQVVNVASAAGYVATEALAAYSTTKFAVVGLSEALRDELVPHGIGVTAVCPGLINTPITQTAPLRGPEATPEARAYMVEVYRRRNYPPERVAANVLKAIQRNRAVAPISPEAWGMYVLKRLAPGLVARINRAMSARTRRAIEGRRGKA